MSAMDRPLVSIVMSLYNSERYLREAVDSVLSQTLTEFEFIIIDDGSKDSSSDVVKSYSDSRIRLIQQKNTGLPAALNAGIRVARADLIARMDPDDICLPSRLEKQLEFMMQHPNVVVLGSAAQLIDAESENICTLTLQCGDEVLRERFPDSPFIHPSVMFRKEAWETVGGYSEFMQLGGEDAILFGKLSKVGMLANLDLPLICYRITPGSLSRKPAAFQELLRKIIVVEIDGHHVSEGMLKQLHDSAKMIDRNSALFQYHFEIVKRCLWSGGNSRKAKYHLDECLSNSPFSFNTWLLYGISLLPGKWIRHLYGCLKGDRFSPTRTGQ